MTDRKTLRIPDDWDGESWQCVRLMLPDSTQWRAAVAGAVGRLTYGRMWDERSGSIADVQTISRLIFDQFVNSGPCDDCGADDPGECRTYIPNSAAFTYWPNHPTYQPNLSTPYPFGIYTSQWSNDFGLLSWLSELLGGGSASDVWCGFAEPYDPSDPGELVEAGQPTATFWFNGEGTVEVHYLQIPLGGYAQIQIDNNPFSTRYISMSLDWLTAIEGGINLAQEAIEEFTVTGPGPHNIEIRLFAIVTESFPFVGWGGGLRSVVLCGEDMTGVIPVPELRVTDCRLEIRYPGGEWQEIPGDYDLCAGDVVAGPHTLVRQNPADPDELQSSADGGESWTPYADLSLATLSQLELRQNPDAPCVLEVSKDFGSSYEQFADLRLCKLPPDPPDPPPATDQLCHYVTGWAQILADLFAEIAGVFAYNGWWNIFTLAEATTWLRRTYPDYWGIFECTQVYLLATLHSGPLHDYAPLLDSDRDQVVAELRCALYCLLFGTTAPWYADQFTWASELYDYETGELTLIDPTNTDAPELLNWICQCLQSAQFSDSQWLDFNYLATLSETGDDCLSCGCVGGEEALLHYDPLVYEWVGTYPADWGATAPAGLGFGWSVNDVQPSGGSGYRRSAHIFVDVPFGDVRRVSVTVDTYSLGSVPGGLRIWTIDRAGVVTQAGSTLALVEGLQTLTVDVEVDDVARLMVFYIVDQQPVLANLQGGGTIHAVEAWFEPASLADEQPVALAVDQTASPGAAFEQVFPQVLRCDPAYKEGGVGVWWCTLYTVGDSCFDWRVRPAWSPIEPPGDTSQSSQVQCSGTVQYIRFDQTIQQGQDTALQRFQWRSENETRFYLLVSDRGTE